MAMNKTQLNKLQECMFYVKVKGGKNKGFFPSLQAGRPKYVQNGNKAPKRLKLSLEVLEEIEEIFLVGQ